MRVAFYTLGCKVNTYETESLSELFLANDFTRVSHKEIADVYVINTCSVTNSGDSKSRKAIRKLIKLNPEAVIAVMGCYSQLSADEVYSIDGVDIVIGTMHREQLLEHVNRVLRDRQKISNVQDVSRYRVFDEVNVTNFTESTRAFLKIQDGCNNFCSYCIIPFARGPVRSRPKESIIEEAKSLVENGYQEIVLTGIHTGGYGTDLEQYSFYDLLLELSTLKGLNRIRISSIEINELTDDIIDLLAHNNVFARHLHIPLQSGSETILKQMRRKYTKQEFKDRIDFIRHKIPNIAITTDIITGFPGETDDMFEEMVEFTKIINFSEMHVFPYSMRSGTTAAKMKDQINGVIKSIRVNRLLSVSEEMANQYISKSSPDIASVLFETSDSEYTYGHSDTYIRVKTKKDESLHNTIQECIITHPKYRNTIVELKKGWLINLFTL